MNRCQWLACKLLLLFALSLLGLPLASQAQMRQFPASAEAAQLEVTTPPVVLLNGQMARLSPGSRIRNAANLIVTPATLVGQRHWVRVVRDPQGLLHDLWVLSAAEVQAQRESLPSLSNWVSGDQTNTPVDDGKTPFNQLPTFPQR